MQIANGRPRVRARTGCPSGGCSVSAARSARCSISGSPARTRCARCCPTSRAACFAPAHTASWASISLGLPRSWEGWTLRAEAGFYRTLKIGPGVIGNAVFINLDERVRIGRNVTVGPHVLIYTGSHQVGPASKRHGSSLVARPVTLEDGCWIGLGAIILPGVTIGRGAIVGAGAVVEKTVPANAYVAGNRAVVIRQLPCSDR